jgi:hypothetical protein
LSLDRRRESYSFSLRRSVPAAAGEVKKYAFCTQRNRWLAASKKAVHIFYTLLSLSCVFFTQEKTRTTARPGWRKEKNYICQ